MNSKFRYGSGLYNEGNTCFMNAMLQCLSHLPGILGLFKLWTKPMLLTNSRDECLALSADSASLLWKTLYVLMSRMNQCDSAQSTKSFRRVFYKHSFLSSGRMHDAAEFLHSLINIIHDQESKRFLYKLSGMKLSKEERKALIDISNPLLQKTLGYSLIIRRCSKCGHHSKSVEKFHILTLPLPVRQNVSEMSKDHHHSVFKKKSYFGNSWNKGSFKAMVKNRKRKFFDSDNGRVPFKKPCLPFKGLLGGYNPPGMSSTAVAYPLATNNNSNNSSSNHNSFSLPKVTAAGCSSSSSSSSSAKLKASCSLPSLNSLSTTQSSNEVQRLPWTVRKWTADAFVNESLSSIFQMNNNARSDNDRNGSSSSNNQPMFGEQHCIQLEQLLHQQSQVQNIHGLVECANCGRGVRTQHLQKTFLANTPDYFLVQLARFNWHRGSFRIQKDSRRVLFPPKLNVPVLSSSGCQQLKPYYLNSLICHVGSSPNCGHYKAYVRVPHADVSNSSGENTAWLCYDDDVVTKISWKEVARAEAYILCYIRQQH